jgi:hypothetical protein
MQELIKDDLSLKQLNQYFGTERYYNVFDFNVTEGINYIMNNGYSWFVTDVLSVVLFNKEIQSQEFLSIKLKVLNNKAEVTITNGNDKILSKYKYKYTDAERDLNLYLTNNVLMLSSEY